jgi:tetratricopeptide (TPR) repeat protein
VSRKDRRRRKAAEEARAEAQTAGPQVDIAELAGTVARTPWAFPAILVVLTLAIYARSVPMGLVYFDDDVYLFEDPRLDEVSLSNFGEIVAKPFFANYHPVTTLTYAFDRAVWGKWLPGFRLTHLAFYAGGVVLLYYLFRMLLGSAPAAAPGDRTEGARRYAAFAGAAIYATHTIHVEAVAWLAQRKDVVCLVFYAASVLAYVRYSREEERPWRFYAASLAFAVLACLSKGYAVVLPGVFIAYDLCFAERFRRRQVFDKLPFIAVSALVTAATIYSQKDIKALVASSYTTGQRIVLLCKVFAAYVGRTILPVRLSGQYTVAREWLGAWAVAAGILLAAGAVAGFFLLRRKRPSAAFGIALFMLPLATVMNVLRYTLRIWIADRYLFFPTIGSSLALAAAGLWLFRRTPRSARPARGWMLAAAAGATIVLYSALTVARIPVWGGPVALWSDALRKRSGLPGSGPVTYAELQRIAGSGKRGLRLVGRLDQKHIAQIAAAYGRQGKEEEARRFLSGVARERGNEYVLAQLALKKGRYDEAVRLAQKVADAGEWNAADAWALIGNARAMKKDYDGAREAFARALELKDAKGLSGADTMQDLGLVEFRAGKFKKAAEWYRRSREADPGVPQAALGLAMVYEKMGRLANSVEQYREVLRLDPENPQAALGLGMVYEKMGRFANAIEQYREVLRLDPDNRQRKNIEATIARLRRKLSAPGPGGPK